jgi:hypothetical protein
LHSLSSDADNKSLSLSLYCNERIAPECADFKTTDFPSLLLLLLLSLLL